MDNWLIRGTELVGLREALQYGAFPQGKSSVLGVMSEAPRAEVRVLRGDRRGRRIPGHSAVNAAERSPGLLGVAGGTQGDRPILPGAAWLGVLDSINVNWRQIPSHVESVGFIGLSGREFWQLADRLFHRDVPVGRVRRLGQVHGTNTAGHKHQAPTLLRNAIV